MPYKRRRFYGPTRAAKRPYRRHSAYKKRPYRRRRYNTLRIPNAFPAKAIVSHKYCCKGEFDPSFGAQTKRVSFRANGMYDPETATGGHQPLLFVS